MWRRRPLLTLAAFALVGVAVWMVSLDMRITNTFEGRRWDLPARVYAAPTELFVGKRLSADQLEAQLRRLGYRQTTGATDTPGTYRRNGEQIVLHRRAATFWDGSVPARPLRVLFTGDQIRVLDTVSGTPVTLARLDPLMIGSVFAAHGEDRLILAPEEVPSLLKQTLLLVEDRRFESHWGLDVRAIARAAWANLRAGRVTQGGSTLTQQLVKSYFLTNERSFRRKFREAAMSVLLEARFSKEDILTAYINEIYMGQDGTRAIHGFALASQFYFARPVAELEPAQLALLVAMVRGPSYYSPTRFVDRVKARRDRILVAMHEADLLSESARDVALATPIRVASRDVERSNYYPAFVDLVRRQLSRDYAAEDLQQAGLLVHTTMDPMLQSAAQRALSEHLELLGRSDESARSLQGAVVVVEPRLGDVQALVGGRARVGSGFNRALEARRQIGSLIKPIVYLTALQSGDWHLGSLIEDAPLSIAGDDGSQWTPRNFSDSYAGEVPLFRALAESINLATVRLGLTVGLRPIARTLARLGGPEIDRPYPSLLLGAVEMTPFEVANLYVSLASDGLRPPLRAVREVVSADGSAVSRYPLEVDSVADSDSLYQLQTGLVQVARRGTGRRLGTILGESVTVAGKTGTTNDFRDAWFAGFSADRLAVVWVGNDDNTPSGLTGSRAALPVWGALMAAADPRSLQLSAPPDSRATLLHYVSGLRVDTACDDAVVIGVPSTTDIANDRRCRRAGLGGRALKWLRDTF